MSNPHSIPGNCILQNPELIRRAKYFHPERASVGVGKRQRKAGSVQKEKELVLFKTSAVFILGSLSCLNRTLTG